ncbi:hypothetical protein BT69DRAFT_1226313, partial [Atractiella rhizophila]
RPAVTLKMILLVDKLDHSNCFDAAVLACAIITFFSLFRLGETTVRSHKSFNPAKPNTHDNLSRHLTEEDFPYLRILLRNDKSLPPGHSQVLRLPQTRLGDVWTMDLIVNHLRIINSSNTLNHLFAYIDHKKNDGSLQALTCSAFLY